MAPHLSYLLALALATATMAAPATQTCQAVQQNANFDDLPTNPIFPFISGNLLIYKGLYYQSFGAGNVTTKGQLPGVLPHSYSNFVGSGPATDQDGTPMWTVNYQDSTTKSFSLNSFYYGCVLTLGQTVTAPPEACILDIAGYRGADNAVDGAQPVCVHRWQYNPSSNIGAQQMSYSGAITDCNDIQFAVITLSLPGGESILNSDVAMAFDDIHYSTKSC